MNKYHVWINCSGFQRIVVEADNPEAAEDKAISHFQCDEGGAGDIDKGETRIATEDDLQSSQDYTL